MPNHIQNKLQFLGETIEIEKLMNHIKSEEMPIDFNKIVEMPKELDISIHSGIETWIKICNGHYDFKLLFKENKSNDIQSITERMSTSIAFDTLLGERGCDVGTFSDEEYNTFIQGMNNYRKHGFYSWYEWAIENWGTKWNAYSQPDKRNTENTIYFQTAWSSPKDLIKLLSSQFPNVEINLTYADEDSGSNTGIFNFLNGEIVNSVMPESCSLQAYDIYFDLHPNDRENYQLVEGKYEYIDSEV